MKINYKCCIVGGGPAGVMLGYIMAKYGVEVVVLEKHKDFFRDFRGDTIHPSTMNILHQLGDLDDFLKIPHNETNKITAKFGNKEITVADFSRLNIRTAFIAFTPQWNFLNFLAEKGNKLPSFNLMMETKAIDLIKENGKIVGVKAVNPDGEFAIYADIVVGTDGRNSMTREKAKFKVLDLGSPIDVLWFSIIKHNNNEKQSFLNANNGNLLILIDRDGYWQCGFIIQKGGYEFIKEKGINYFRQELTNIVPKLKENIQELKDFTQIKTLDIKVDRLEKWYTDGLICIGDAAHAMSPIGGVGINLAIQDAVAAANILVPILKERKPSQNDLRKIQERRMYPTKFTQAVQVIIQNKSLQPYLGNKKKQNAPSILKLFQWIPFLRRFPARFIGLGIRSEKIEL